MEIDDNNQLLTFLDELVNKEEDNSLGWLYHLWNAKRYPNLKSHPHPAQHIVMRSKKLADTHQ